MKHYDELTVDRLDRSYIKLSVKSFMLDGNEGPNQLIIEPSEHIRTDEYVKVHASIDTDKRIIFVKGPHEYLKHEFIYPEGTTHFVYDEFISENTYRIRRPVPLKIEDDIFHDAKEFLGEEKIFAYYRDGEKFCLVVDERADLEKLSGKHEKYSYTKKAAK